jgi:uncharacterized protein YbjQ (UPF0145 family)
MRTILIASLYLVAGCDFDEVRHDHEALHAQHDDDDHDGHEHGHAHAAHRYVSPAEAARIQVLESENNERDMEAMGVVDAHEKPGHHDEALQELREAAAALGADAVVGVEFHHGEGGGAVSHLSGMAVRYRKLIRDEPYDIVGFLDVAMDMEDQDGAIRELQRQSSRYHADLIIGIHYEHGEGNGEKIHLKGKAIRYRSSAGGNVGAMP